MDKQEGGNASIVDLSQAVSVENKGSAPDPNIWLDPFMVKNISKVIMDALVVNDPQSADLQGKSNPV